MKTHNQIETGGAKPENHERGSNVIGVTWVRWYILGVFVIYTFSQAAIWNIFGPIAKSAQVVFCWGDYDLEQFPAMGTYLFLITVIPNTYLLHRSLRLSMIVNGALILASSLLRCIPVLMPSISLYNYTLICYIAQILNGMGGPQAMSACLTVSANWFPPKERNFSTAIGQMLNPFGVGMAFLFGIIFVSNCSGGEQMDLTIIDGSNCTNGTMPWTQSSLSFSDLKPVDLRNRIMNLNYFYAAITVVLMVLIIAYFPSKPKQHASQSSKVDREDFLSSFKNLAMSKDVWLVTATYCFPQGIGTMWQSVMVLNLTALTFPGNNSLSECWVSQVGIIMTVVYVISAILVAPSITFLKNRFKLLIIILLGLGSVFLVFCTLLTEQVISLDNLQSFKTAYYIVLLPGVAFSFATSPLAFELSVETCFPVSEGVLGGWLTGWFNVMGIIFYLVGFAFSDTRWLNFMLPLSTIIPLLFIVFVKEKLKRHHIDNK